MYVLAISSTTNCDLHLQEFEVDGHKAFPNMSCYVVDFILMNEVKPLEILILVYTYICNSYV